MKMKKIAALLFGIVMLACLAGCSGTRPSSEDNSATASATYTSALEILDNIFASYDEDQKFPITGGDSENMSMDGPAVFDVTKTEELDTILGLPKSEAAHIDDAASAIHMMNANTFTGAAYHLTDDADMESFVSAVKENILAKQWICGMPDTLIILGVGDQYVITAYGAEDIIEVFQTQALSSLDGATMLIETPAVE